MNKRIACCIVALGLGMPALAVESTSRKIGLSDRIAAQKAIERVYWSHRIWPEENSSPKPPLSAVLSDGAIRARVENTLQESNALDQLWHRPITAMELQAELNRIVRSSRDPGMLRELFAALGNDATLIAETLARQTLADRLVRGWYAHDVRFHGELKRRAEAALAACANPGCMKSMGGRYVEITWKRRSGSEDPRAAGARDERVVLVEPEEWNALLDRWARRTGFNRLADTADAYSIEAILAQGADSLTTASVVWDKTPFDVWWEAQGPALGATIEAPAASYSLDEPADGTCTVDTWAQTPYSLEARTGHTAVWTGTEMIVWGGVLFNSGGRYNPATDSWQQTSRGANVPSARYEHSAVWTGTEMIVWGGDTTNTIDTDRTSDTGGRYNPVTDSWAPTSVSGAPAARNSHTAVWTGSRMIVWGGVNPNPPGFAYLNSGGRYDPVSDSWAPLPALNPPSGRHNHTAVWTGTEMIVWGGSHGTDQTLDSGGRYNPSTNSWQFMSTDNAPSGRFGHTAVWTGTQMIVWGGTSSVYEQTGGRYDPATDSWLPTSVGANLPEFRTSHTAVWTGSRMIVWGGRSALALDSGGRYDPVADSWEATPTGPAGRLGHTAVWTGSEMIVWGGQYFGGLWNSGGRYAPSTNSWVATAIDSNGEPSERRGHTAVWTGTEMIVWGGFTDDISPLGTGGRYAPVTNVWLPVSAGGSAPSARARHTALWTGTEMIVWGGTVTSGPNTTATNSGGRYNPSSDSWQATPRGSHVAHARAGHVAVWTGAEMIVWGGRDASVLDSGGRLNLSSGSWTTMPTAGAPSARENATAVWTGTEMIVWGGDGVAGFLNSGGRYAPSGNVWQPTSQAANVPDARSGHTAVWSGTRMIVWGGTVLVGTNAQAVNTGGRYDPGSDSWTTTPVSGDAPSARTEHTAVWTGTELIVWGGGPDAAGARYGHSGGRYNPSNDSWLATSTGADVPVARGSQSAVWTGSEMIVWAGAVQNYANYWSTVASGGRYCADSCASPATLYQDVDGDGYGVSGVTQVTCGHPANWAALAGDCNESNAAIHPGAVETCNQLDDDCDGIIDGADPDGDGIRDACDDCALAYDPAQSDFDHDGRGDLCDLDDGVIYLVPTDKAHVRWQQELGPDHWNVYEGDLAVLKASGEYTQVPGSNTLAARRCGLTVAIADDLVSVPAGAVKFALVTGVTAGVEGGLGTNSGNVGRPNTHPCP